MTRRVVPLALSRPSSAPAARLAPVCPPGLPVSRWAVQFLCFHPDPLQAAILDSPAHRLILLCARQFGKSTLAAIKALHFALSHPNATVLCVSPTLRRSTEWLRLVRHFCSILATPRKNGPAMHGASNASAPAAAARMGLTRATETGLFLPNRSRILALPGTAHSNRGYSAHLLLFEEAAFIPDPVFTALLPSVAATGGAVWLISSAGAPAGFFYDIWTRASLPYARFRADATQCPRITREHLEEARLALGDLRFRREYLCEFSPDAIPVFSAELLESALDDSFDPWLAREAA